MQFFRWKNLFIVLIISVILTAGISFALHEKGYSAKQAVAVSNNLIATSGFQDVMPPPSPPQKLNNPPEIVKAVYVTGYSAGTKKYLNYLTNLFKNTEINAVVIDIKDYSGLVSYASGAENVKKYNLYNGAIKDVDALVRSFHDKNIYVIGRIAVFEDPAFSKSRPDLAVYNKAETTDLSQPVLWQDNNGLSWLDPSSKEVWDYDISLAKDAFYHGFDEVNFDYVRFPSDGKIGNTGFPVWNGKTPMSAVIKNFFQYVRSNLAGEKISVDLFGQTTVNKDDMGIGQIIESAFENFNYVSPMVYPSHFINGFMGFANPAEHPYDIVKYSMDSGLAREKTFLIKKQDLATMENDATSVSTASDAPITKTKFSVPTPIMVPLAKFRPWLQDFNMGADYTADMVKAEIKATQDSLGNDFSGFMLWNPSNIYTQGAVEINNSAPAK